ncbi:MAG TPA: glycosyl hydrolase, partial [Candidatus Synoicihabitans sp.]|nr:glycosyl hydrolase [Candidatus Synoicihabitans sp.]
MNPCCSAAPQTARSWLWRLLVFVTVVVPAQARLGEPSRVSEVPTAGAFPLVHHGRVAPLWVAGEDHPGVRRATRTLSEDIARVTSYSAEVVEPGADAATGVPVVIGTLGRSPLIDQWVREGKLDVAAISGRWEAFMHQVVEAPAPNIARGFVIVGSDPRGAIYGVYELSEQIGVSPWYWWADVPARRRAALHVAPTRHVDDGPVV